MYLVTGGLGFIGSNIVKSLSSINPNDKIFIVDKISNREKYLNLPSLRNIELFEPCDLDELLSYFQKNNLPKSCFPILCLLYINLLSEVKSSFSKKLASK